MFNDRDLQLATANNISTPKSELHHMAVFGLDGEIKQCARSNPSCPQIDDWPTLVGESFNALGNTINDAFRSLNEREGHYPIAPHGAFGHARVLHALQAQMN